MNVPFVLFRWYCLWFFSIPCLFYSLFFSFLVFLSVDWRIQFNLFFCSFNTAVAIYAILSTIKASSIIIHCNLFSIIMTSLVPENTGQSSSWNKLKSIRNDLLINNKSGGSRAKSRPFNPKMDFTFTKIQKRITNPNDPHRRRILWIVSKSWCLGFMIRVVSYFGSEKNKHNQRLYDFLLIHAAIEF